MLQKAPQHPPARWPAKLQQHPAVFLVMCFLTVTGYALAIYFYLVPARSPNLTFYFHPSRTNVVSLDGDRNLTVLYAGKPITDTVTIVEVGLWNAGKLPIFEADVLVPVILTAPSSVRLLTASVKNSPRAACKFAIDTSEKAEGKIRFNWHILEKGDGATIQLTFEGPSDASFTMSGSVVGQPSLTTIDLLHAPPMSPATRSLFGLSKPLVVVPVFLLTILIMVHDWRRNPGPFWSRRNITNLLPVLLAGIIFLAVIMDELHQPPVVF